MIAKLKEVRAMLTATEAKLTADLERVKARGAVIDEMIAEEESLVTPVVEATAEIKEPVVKTLKDIMTIHI